MESGPVPLRDQLSRVIARATWGGERQLAAALAPCGLTVPQYFTLVAIDGAGACTMGTLASRTHHALGTATGLVDRLIRQGLVDRRSQAADRRVVLVQLTASGAAILAQVEAMRRGRLEAALAAMGEPAVRRLICLLDGYRTAMEIAATEVPIDTGTAR